MSFSHFFSLIERERLQKWWSQQALLLSLCSYVIGCVAAQQIGFRPSLLAWLLLGMSLSASAVVYRYFRRWSWGLLYLSVAYFGALHTATEIANWPIFPTSVRKAWIGRVIHAPKVYPKSIRVDMAIEGYKIQTTLVRAEHAHDRLPDVGDFYLLHGAVSPLRASGTPYVFRYDEYLRRQYYAGQLVCFQGEWEWLRHDGHLSIWERWRRKLLQTYSLYFHDQSLALLAAITLGQREQLETSTRQLFMRSGSAHLLALSGLHLSILLGTYLFLLRIFRKHYKCYLWLTLWGIPMIWCYTALVGFPISLVRAAIMLSLMLATHLLQRETLGFHHLTWAAWLLLLIQPSWLWEASFQLSFVAVGALLLAAPALQRLVNATPTRLGKLFCSCCGTALIAQTATWPLVAYHFHQIPLYGVLAAPVAIPLTYLLLLGAFVFFLIPPLQPFLAGGLQGTLQGLLATLQFVGNLPYAVWPCYIDGGVAGCILLWLLCATAYAYAPRPLLRYTTWGSTLLCVLAIWHQSVTERVSPQLIFYAETRVPCVHCLLDRHHHYLYTPTPTAALSQLSAVRTAFWQRVHLDSVTCVFAPYHDRYLLATQHLLQIGHFKLAWANDNLPRQQTTQLPIDVLYLVRGCHLSLTDLLRTYRPRHIVLDQSVTEHQRERWHREADSLHLSVYDLQREPSLIIPLPTSSPSSCQHHKAS